MSTPAMSAGRAESNATSAPVPGWRNARAALAALGRQALHAYLLTIEHPVTGEILTWEAALPEDLLLLQNALRAAE